MNKKNFFSFIIILFLSIVCFGVIFLFSIDKKKDNYSNLKIVKDYNIYFSVVENINYYINSLGKKNKNVVYSLLDINYINKKRINKTNVLDKVALMEKDILFSGKRIYYLNWDNKYLFLANGILINKETQEIVNNDYKVALLVDYDLLVVSVYPLQNEEDVDYIIDIDIKTNNYNNLIPSRGLSDDNMCKLYYEDFIKYVNNDIDGLYNILSDNIKINYSFEDFKKIINNKFNDYKYSLNNCVITYNNENNTKIFNVLDKNNNKVRIYENGVMNYNIDFNLN